MDARTYQIHEFAELAGVTVKALHHYDRLGLLCPERTGAGYRLYREADLETLEQIVALKFLGLPLQQIGELLNRSERLPDAMRIQRRALEDKRALIDRAITAISAAEDSLRNGESVGKDALSTIIKVVEMQDGIEGMKKYYSDEAWERRRRYYEEGPSEEWRALYRDGAALLGTDPASDEAQALLERWFQLSRRAWLGEPEVQTDSPMAWLDRQNWLRP
jgi:DNA-binding transcriptional MerR regulator